MPSQIPPSSGEASPAYPPCIEHGIWSPIPVDFPKGPLNLKLKDVDADEARVIRERDVMSFHAVGCSGDFKEHLPGLAVAKAMAGQIGSPQADGGNPAAVGASF